ncbi:glutamine synthetase [Candidatus Bathyarchaeota archaeon]|nr:MAG: glutamine synthetase [Candidatus Bathyarchaeota archaeon]
MLIITPEKLIIVCSWEGFLSMGVQGLVVPLIPVITGGVRCKYFPAEKLPSLLEKGYGFDGSSCDFCHVEDSDLLAKLDPRTKVEIDGHALFICDVYKAGERFDLDTRFALQRALAQVAEAGFGVVSGTEVEFYVLKSANSPEVMDLWRYMEPLYTHDVLSLISGLATMVHDAVGIEFVHHEAGPGQFELTLERDTPVSLADRITLAKWAIKYWVSKHGFTATFMPKPFMDRPGNGMHLHLSLTKGGRNVMGPGGRRGDGKRILSEEGASFLAGILTHAKALTALMSSTVNSYKRFMPHSEAPTFVCWSIGNRSALVRIPEHDAARGDVRLEVRCPDPACNPYLALAGLLTAGLKGLEEGLELPDPVEESVYGLREEELEAHGVEKLPSSLREAVELAKKDPVVREALGPRLAEQFFRLKEAEWRAYVKFLEETGEEGEGRVTSWELREYLVRA